MTWLNYRIRHVARQTGQLKNYGWILLKVFALTLILALIFYVRTFLLVPRGFALRKWNLFNWSLALRDVSALPLLPNDHGVTHRIVLCAKVAAAEAPYIVEWVEFHRQQGIEKFALYLDDYPSTRLGGAQLDQIRLLPELYEKRMNLPTLINIYSGASFLQAESAEQLLRVKDVTTQMHRLVQQSMLLHCQRKYETTAEWILHIDVDEFLYAPKHPTIAEYLQSLYTADTRIGRAYRSGNLSSLYISPVNFGMAATDLLSPRVALVSDPVTADVRLLFDPRSRPQSAEGKNPGMEKEGTPTTQSQMLAFINELSSILKDTDDKYRTASAVFGDLMEQRDKNPYLHAQDHLNPIDLKVWRSISGRKSDVVDKTSLQLAESLLTEISSHAAEVYPLVTQTQTLRAYDTLIGDQHEKGVAATLEAFPECEEYMRKLSLPENIKLWPKHMEKKRNQKLGLPPHELCVPGNLPAGFTNAGKSLFWNGVRFDPPASPSREVYTKPREISLSEYLRPKKNPRYDNDADLTERCLVPWVHTCAHFTQSPQMLADATHELRLDHHQLRSLEARTINDASWRSPQGWGKFRRPSERIDFSSLKTYSIIEDDTKLRFQSSLRKGIALLLPEPVEFVVSKPIENRLQSYWRQTTCSLLRVLFRKEHMCPQSFPRVTTPHVSNTSLVPDATTPTGWCSNSTELNIGFKTTSLFAEAGQSVISMCSSNIQSHFCETVLQPLQQVHDPSNIAVCPGSPLTGCCDFDSRMADLLNVVAEGLGFREALNSTYREYDIHS